MRSGQAVPSVQGNFRTRSVKRTAVAVRLVFCGFNRNATNRFAVSSSLDSAPAGAALEASTGPALVAAPESLPACFVS